ncbi:hypothetical protein BKA70DRAFT_1237564 [Coprinopsis sp. MPI-PUGE-AT-0042]|nr:hypothetical protein BKA70DRAFT_1237564 [Coprinopsis sp. MPI-PUGE-AT-0042]
MPNASAEPTVPTPHLADQLEPSGSVDHGEELGEAEMVYPPTSDESDLEDDAEGEEESGDSDLEKILVYVWKVRKLKHNPTLIYTSLRAPMAVWELALANGSQASVVNFEFAKASTFCGG